MCQLHYVTTANTEGGEDDELWQSKDDAALDGL